MIIAIDGPAGAGKSTVAKILAKRLGFFYIDTGAMYRALTLKIIEKKSRLDDIVFLAALAQNTTIDLVDNPEDDSLKVLLDGRDVSQEIRRPAVTRVVSDVAKIKELRGILLEAQRKLGRKKNSILDGRDIGTVVFPDADIKFYLDAKLDERVSRRFKELKETEHDITAFDVKKDLHNRDTIDSTRSCAPLRKADDAVYIDTTEMSIEEVVESLRKHIGAIEHQNIRA